ncbi:hypothetical protein ACLB1Q_13175 [Escherichia coli]
MRLQSVPGVTPARVNLAERTALVMGSASPQDLQAVEKAGYGAEAIEDDAKRRERQQETAHRYDEALHYGRQFLHWLWVSR